MSYLTIHGSELLKLIDEYKSYKYTLINSSDNTTRIKVIIPVNENSRDCIDDIDLGPTDELINYLKANALLS